MQPPSAPSHRCTAPSSPWSERGTIHPSLDLAIGDSVTTRVFDAAGEHPELETRITIGSASEGLRNNWAHQLATRINAEQAQLRAGQLGQDGRITPAFGQKPGPCKDRQPVDPGRNRARQG
ncbi:hypothetical protein [Massilia pseudoviolaceinigra]|uniref:hypothetical protein n=1 Tax=Massilia pseudoviolaceinigra TaxID=3057165 RepID=UPI0027967F97|nr:hypothetical protein [Massilia sp. CCM 9206]MDQ1924835.1 hypothetical protein [Massilia sp. CCM 9206]